MFLICLHKAMALIVNSFVKQNKMRSSRVPGFGKEKVSKGSIEQSHEESINLP